MAPDGARTPVAVSSPGAAWSAPSTPAPTACAPSNSWKAAAPATYWLASGTPPAFAGAPTPQAHLTYIPGHRHTPISGLAWTSTPQPVPLQHALTLPPPPLAPLVHPLLPYSLRPPPPRKAKPGLRGREGRVRDSAGIGRDSGAARLAPRVLAKLARIKPDSLPRARGNPRLGVPFAGATKFVAIGLNYSDHAAETGNPIPAEPIVFHKTLSCMQGGNDDVMLPRGSKKTDWEVELAFVIGTRAREE